MKHRVLLVVTFLASLVLLATSLCGCGITPLEAEPTYEIDTVVVPSATATRAATAPRCPPRSPLLKRRYRLRRLRLAP